MSNSYLTCFMNTDRPELDHPSLNLPNGSQSLGKESVSQLISSLRADVEVSGEQACAASARFWESLLEEDRAPYLLLIVADMRYALGSRSTALPLYREVQAVVHDPHLTQWIEETQVSLQHKKKQSLLMYKSPSSEYTPSQRWIPTAGDSFPYCKLQSRKLQDLQDTWQKLNVENLKERFLNTHCLDTNYIEGTFELDHNSNDLLATRGFYDTSHFGQVQRPQGGSVRNPDDAISILQDTRNALDESYALANQDPHNTELTVKKILHLHTTLMKTSRIIFDERNPHRGRLSYTNIGVTRKASSVNVSASTTTRGQTLKVQFCPYDEVEDELGVFCKRFNEIIQKPEIDPFACAAWISHVFVAIHPFEDGNGRLSRMLSSIPLIRNGLPPLCVGLQQKDAYISALNSTRATPRWGDYEGLMNVLYSSTKARTESLLVDLSPDSNV